MARRANTIHPGILIGLVVLTIVAAVAALIANDLNDQLAAAKTAKETADTQKAKALADWQAEHKLRIDQGRFVYGWDSNGENPKMDISSLEKWMISRFSDKIGSNATTEEQKVKALLNAQVIVTEYEEEPARKLQEEIERIKGQYEANKTQLEATIENLNQQHSRRVQGLQDEINEKDTQLGNQAARIGELEQELDTTRENHQAEVDRLNDRIVSITFEKDNEIGTLKREIQRLQVAIGELQQKIEENTRETRRQLTPDGEVINVAAAFETRTAYINLGKNDRLSRGLRFEVFQYGAGGVQRKKGEVIVREVYDYTAKVGIVSLVDELDPIVVGDKIANVAFDSKKAFSFGLIGTFDKFTKEELKRLIEREGSTVSAKIESGLDYIVVGKFNTEDPSDPENLRYKLAKDFHIQILNEDEIRKYLRDYSN